MCIRDRDDAACMADLVVVELTEVLHIHLDLVDVGHGNEAAQLNIQMLGHALDSAVHVGQLADAGGLDDDAVGEMCIRDRSITHSPALAKWRSGGKWRLLGLGHRN